MLNTAFISFIVDSGGGFDANGNPTTPTKTPSVYINCNHKTITRDYKTLVDGQYKQGKYSIYIKNEDIPTGVNINVVREVSIKDLNENVLGCFFVQNMEPMSRFSQTKLIVGI